MPDPAPRQAAAKQLAFDELDTPLYDTTFVVVDLETTGTRADGDAITEIGAVKVRGGEVLGEFATLVNPGREIPPAVVHVTGITTAMVYAAPRIESVLPGFLEFAAGAVLVAHNARFDMAFLRAAAARCETEWPKAPVLCTVKLARRVLGRDEAPSVRLASLARLLGASTQPTHRALDDARATVDVLHALIARVGNQGVHSLTELMDYLPDVSSGQRAKRVLATDLPAAPGVYLFRGPADEVLYIGTAVNLRRRVRNYFTGSETRGRMKEMVALATRVDHVVCAHALEAGVRELRLLVAHAPPYNRRSKFPKRGWWIALTDEPFPRFTIVRTPTRDALGPFSSRLDAADVAATVAEHAGLRTCTARLPRGGRHECPPAVVGGCPAATPSGIPIDTKEYAPAPAAVRALFRGESDATLRAMLDRIETHSAAEHFEAAARLRDRTVAVIRALRRTQRLAAVARIAELVAAHPDGAGGWEFAVIRYGRLAGSGTARRGTPPMPIVEQIVAAAETVIPEGGATGVRADGDLVPPALEFAGDASAKIGEPTAGDGAAFDAPPLRGASPEEVGLVARWLARPGVRIVRSTHGYCEPRYGAGRWIGWAEVADAAARTLSELG
ncbi:DEDD exonuclease domain-containing protein [Nocardia bhagyanarayanae]|uniref:DNA polymerase-3 subunit epsilon n=1 Tax=Nocardia bhagyanarayanae TaxID=1215925 RepID=A0A543EWH2_9NOCA|nr:DEDD exonuclease domain-containing protein [Nocardia bhagyanarayanae]TQM25948.1 DNA polymerase-3 subunit epsilon [Nocardia bhagyanarayanae]